MTPRHRAYLKLRAEAGDHAAHEELLSELRRHTETCAMWRALCSGAVLVSVLYMLAVLLLSVHP